MLTIRAMADGKGYSARHLEHSDYYAIAQSIRQAIMFPRMNSQVADNTEAAILARVIEAGPTEITPEIARYLLSMRLPVADGVRVDELSEKARNGSLSEAEAAELDSYLHIGTLLGVLQARARRLLKNAGSLSSQ